MTDSKEANHKIPDIGLKIMKLRLDEKMPIKQIAKKLGCSSSTASKYSSMLRENESIKDEINTKLLETRRREKRSKREKYLIKKVSDNLYKETGRDIFKIDRDSKKAFFVFKAGGECCICKYNKFMGNICFHHINPFEKEHSLNAKNFGRLSISSLIDEVNKCVLLCHNCHGEVHSGYHKTKSLKPNVVKASDIPSSIIVWYIEFMKENPSFMTFVPEILKFRPNFD